MISARCIEFLGCDNRLKNNRQFNVCFARTGAAFTACEEQWQRLQEKVNK